MLTNLSRHAEATASAVITFSEEPSKASHSCQSAFMSVERVLLLSFWITMSCPTGQWKLSSLPSTCLLEMATLCGCQEGRI